MDGQQEPWQELDRELEAWRRERRQATFWWRDDDATRYTCALARLCELAASHGVPLCIAVVPRDVEPGLRAALGRGNVALQHGWAHVNHAPLGEKAAELGHHRPLQQILDELKEGTARLRDALGGDFLPALVPPWNRIGERVVRELRGIGLTGMSTFMPRLSRTRDGLMAVNCHVDPIAWRDGARCRPTHEVLHRLCEHLRQRRLNQVDRAEPTGLLTHHLQHDDAVWRLLPRLLERLGAHLPTVRWLGAAEVFSGA